MFGLSEKDLHIICSILAEFPAIKKAILYGSRALERHRPGSDIDLTLEGEHLDTRVILALSAKLDDSSLPYIFDLSIRSDIENSSLLEHIERAGKIFYERKTF